MDKAQAIHAFWSSFSWPALDEQSAYDENVLEEMEIGDRYITYEVLTASFGEPVSLTASLWCRSTSWEEISKKADEIADYIGLGGRLLKTDSGAIWIKQGTPFAQRMAVQEDSFLRRIYLNIAAEFLTAT